MRAVGQLARATYRTATERTMMRTTTRRRWLPTLDRIRAAQVAAALVPTASPHRTKVRAALRAERCTLQHSYALVAVVLLLCRGCVYSSDNRSTPPCSSLLLSLILEKGGRFAQAPSHIPQRSLSVFSISTDKPTLPNALCSPVSESSRMSLQWQRCWRLLVTPGP